jgi:hypothetical protein
MKTIKFMAVTQDVADKIKPPAPARAYVPDWYRQATRFIGGKMELRQQGINKDLKLCVPFLDALTSGYVIELPADMLVQRDAQGVTFFWHEEPQLLEFRSKDMATTLPRPAGHDQDLYAWVTQWAMIAPPGYSLLVTHPLNRNDLPFTTTSGIIDSDKYSSAGQVPFFLRAGFSGVIPAGTPIMQVIPIKRENWKHEVLPYDRSFIVSVKYSIQRYMYGGYKKLLWQKKDYS